ncbi:MAG: hypothetical protein HY362_03450, partial [Candidatus Aenigmarchaeota archaeon]|nr:hypothetical protein [Candidatus Aenigmarchaeota archaeon]
NISANITMNDGSYLRANGTIGYFNSSNTTASGSGLPIHSMIIQGGSVNPTFIQGDGFASVTINMSKSFRDGGTYALSVNRIYNFTGTPTILPTQGFTILPINGSSFNITYNITSNAIVSFSWIAIGY